uniref:NADH-ubiquinone oxidoreductase chain 4 n=1 Tax=Telamonia vlijmi TaxID=1112492 RepID=A0A060CUS3_TELVL|nr:NADH dehydrogenase subunit 4 [Telamonia vlijmi]AIB04198.1 NADH dehydrogenase subunit 4 [Telamonia vlijmi]
MVKFSLSTSFILMNIINKKCKLSLQLITISVICMIMLMNLSLNFTLLSNMFMMDSLSFIMIMLTMISTSLIFLSSSNLKNISYTMIPIFIILLMTFSSKNMLLFYIMFEMVLIPTMILITMNGKQPERLQASIYLIMYTVMASLPLLMMIISSNSNNSFTFNKIKLLKFSLIIFIMLAFLVKMPMYLTHLWLPKAHVEAPLEGSMILAAVLLKLGGYGIIRFSPMCITLMNKINYWIISISLIGATTTSLNCIRQKDLKSLIAYSSVAHMGFVLTSLFTMNYMGLTGAIIMMIAHGLVSSALFLLVNDLYYKYHTRNILMFKGLMSLMPNITFWWFMFTALNMSAPPSISTMSEIMMMSSLISWNNNSLILIFLMSIMAASFSLMMFVNIIHNKNSSMLISINTEQKIFLSLFIHFIPTLLIIMKLELFI